MITKAKVNIQTVKQFEQAAAQCRDLSPKFDGAISCVDKLYISLENYAKKIEGKNQQLENAKSKIEIKIKNIEEILADLTARLNELELDLESLEGELSSIDSSITITNEDGKTSSFPNPAYVALEAQISTVEVEIEGIKAEMYPHQCRLERANGVEGEISKLIDELNSVLYSISEKKSVCKELHAELENIKNINAQKGQYVVENLKKIQQIVASYMRIKMAYNAGPGNSASNAQSSSTGIYINISINKNSYPSSDSPAPDSQQKIPIMSAADIQEHHIKFDAEEHVLEYDGKSFGGKYNSYDERIKRTSDDNNPILGHYEGARGESKYIPSNRSVEGIVVISILKKFGLDGIEYRNGEPDFEVCATAVVTINGMSENREDYVDSHGDTCLGNFSQADIQLAKSWNFDERDGRKDWTARQVFEYRKANKLTWHEKCDTKTMVLVRGEINAYFKHIGGCSECRLRDAGSGEDEFDE